LTGKTATRTTEAITKRITGAAMVKRTTAEFYSVEKGGKPPPYVAC